jgi:predicted ATPase
MNKAKIKVVEFYLKNYAPFYESMGIREFHFNKRDSPYSTTLIIGSNGSGKSFLITEISPQTIEHIAGRVANRFIDGVEGEKRIHYVVNDMYEYVCTIIYDKSRKTNCFMKKIDLSTGAEEELNPNGNVTSYQVDFTPYGRHH